MLDKRFAVPNAHLARDLLNRNQAEICQNPLTFGNAIHFAVCFSRSSAYLLYV